MGAAVIFLGIVLIIFLFCISVSVVKDFVACLWIIAIMSVALGMCIEHGGEVSASDYLKSPENYQVDTFMVNGILDHYKVSEKSK